MTLKNKNQKKANKPIADYEEIINLLDDKINILIMGTSGCGKSTLINALIEDDLAPTGVGRAVTDKMTVYQRDNLPFRMIDTMGYEFSYLRQLKTKSEIAKWTKDGIKEKNAEKLIHAIWYCIDGTVKRIDDKVLDYIKSVSKTWKNVPIMIVFTKSYSKTEIEENEKMFKKVYSQYRGKDNLNVKAICSVVAKAFPIDENTIVPARGLDELIEKTNELIPEAKRIEKEAVKELDLKFKSSMSNGVIIASSTAAAAIGAIPFAIPDATLLVPLQSYMLNNIARTYKLADENVSNEIVNTIIKVGATTMVAKQLLNALKAIPNVAAAVLNAGVAGAITFVAGEICNVVFAKIYKGEIDMANTDWTAVITVMFNERVPKIIDVVTNDIKTKDINQLIKDLVEMFFPKDKEEKEEK